MPLQCQDDMSQRENHQYRSPSTVAPRPTLMTHLTRTGQESVMMPEKRQTVSHGRQPKRSRRHGAEIIVPERRLNVNIICGPGPVINIDDFCVGNKTANLLSLRSFILVGLSKLLTIVCLRRKVLVECNMKLAVMITLLHI